MNKFASRRGLTLIEILIAIGILAILITTTFVFMDPGRQLAVSRNNRRSADLQTILNAIRQNQADNRTGFTCAAGDLPTSSTKMSKVGGYDIAACLIAPNFISAMPFDPSAAGAHYTNTDDYDSGYFIQKDPATGQVVLTAPSAELNAIIKAP